MMKVKICGMKYTDNIGVINQHNPDYLGFIFYRGSKRFVDDDFQLPILSSDIKKVGVFVNENRNDVLEIAKKFNLNAIQMHGNESVSDCLFLKQQGYRVIKAFSMQDDFCFKQLEEYSTVCDYFLFDTPTANFGGSGKVFNWLKLEKYNLNIPFFLSGGLGAENINEVLKFKHKMLYGYDFNSRLEIAPGLKNDELVKVIIEKIKEYEHI